jgi:hypothetical protein
MAPKGVVSQPNPNTGHSSAMPASQNQIGI